MLRESDEAKFRNHLAKLLPEIEASQKEFHDYFVSNYCQSEKRMQSWAYFARVGSKINVNMFLEAFHKALKHGDLKQRVNIRSDNLIQVLPNVAKRHWLDYIVNVEKPTACSHRIAEMHRRHRSSATMNTADVEEQLDESGAVISYSIKSATNDSKHYAFFW